MSDGAPKRRGSVERPGKLPWPNAPLREQPDTGPGSQTEGALPLCEIQHARVLDAWFANGCRSKRNALMAAGFEPSSLRIFNLPEVRAEIDRRLTMRMGWVEALTDERIIAEYAKIAFSSLGDLLEVAEDGSAYLDLASMSVEQRAAVAEYTVETYTEKEIGEGGEATEHPVKRSKIKFHDKKAALDALARIRGMFKDKVEVHGAVSLIEKVQAARQRNAAPEE